MRGWLEYQMNKNRTNMVLDKEDTWRYEYGFTA